MGGENGGILDWKKGGHRRGHLVFSERRCVFCSSWVKNLVSFSQLKLGVDDCPTLFSLNKCSASDVGPGGGPASRK